VQIDARRDRLDRRQIDVVVGEDLALVGRRECRAAGTFLGVDLARRVGIGRPWIEPMNTLPLDRQIAVISCLCEGMSIRATERITRTHRDTIMRLGAKVGRGCATLHNVMMRDLRVSQIQCDEL
jgi:hypothetical protein